MRLMLFGIIMPLLATSITMNINAANSHIDVLEVKGTINPVLVGYIERGIQQAEKNGAVAVIIQLDTPGGLDTSMRDIVQVMVNSRVPVVVYVSPAGARAASAGVFITMASHVAAMAPNTAIGAAHPVSLGEGEMPAGMEEKVVNDAAAYIRSIAEAHGRNMEWAESAVRESVSATEQEALSLNVIDIVSPDLNTLIGQLDNMQVTMLNGSVITLQTIGISVNHVGMTAIEDFLYAIADPNIAFLLLSLASLGIIIEILNPGLIFPGVVGTISLLFAFYSLGILAVNWAGVLLIILAFGLFAAEVLTTTFGLFTAGGVVSLVIGSMILFAGASPVFQIDPWLIASVVIIITGMSALVVNRVISTYRRQAKTGREELIGKTAVVKTTLNPDGTVFYRGEYWNAISESGIVEPDEQVTILRMEGLTLYVTRKPAKETTL